MQIGGNKTLLNYPENLDAEEFTFTLQEADGTYTDSVNEYIGTREIFVYDDTVYHFTVTVTRGESDELIAEVSGDDIHALDFTNEYQMVFYELETLPETGISSAHPEALSEMPKDLRYTPIGMTLQIPSLNVMSEITTVPLRDGEYPVEWLGMDSGLLSGTALPGQGTSVIAAHNTLSAEEYGPFAMIFDLEPGDRFFIRNAANDLLIYEVYSNQKIDAHDVTGLSRAAARFSNTVTLLTCEDELPEGGYASRRIVSAKLLTR